MTPKEKAKELVFKYENLVTGWDCYWDTEILLEDRLPDMKQCALIAANEMLNDIPFVNNTDQESSKRVFWIYTIEEINKL
jgi:hypothetical protein